MITGMENTLKASYVTDVTAAIESAFGAPVASPNYIPAICEGLSNALIPFLTANLTVNAGIAVATTGSPTAQTGATTAPGTVS